MIWLSLTEQVVIIIKAWEGYQYCNQTEGFGPIKCRWGMSCFLSPVLDYLTLWVFH